MSCWGHCTLLVTVVCGFAAILFFMICEYRLRLATFGPGGAVLRVQYYKTLMGASTLYTILLPPSINIVIDACMILFLLVGRCATVTQLRDKLRSNIIMTLSLVMHLY